MKTTTFAQHEQALLFRARRNEVLSANIVNADTPNYKARDLDFKDVLSTMSVAGVSLKNTNPMHQAASQTHNHGGQLKYRMPMQPSLDGNTVEADVEQAAFAENALRYRITLSFLDGHIRTLKYAIKGGD